MCSKSTYPKCGKSHYDKCLVGTDGCFGSGKDGNKVRDCLDLTTKWREGKQVTTNSEEGFPKSRDRFFDLKSRVDQE